MNDIVYKRFWWYGGTGFQTNYFGAEFGGCDASSATCFQSLPSDLNESNTKLMVYVDDENYWIFNFDPNNNVAHQVWLALAHNREGKVTDGDNWPYVDSKATKYEISAARIDSFAYGDNSFILDDDHCWCGSVMAATDGSAPSYCNWPLNTPGVVYQGPVATCNTGGSSLSLYFASGTFLTDYYLRDNLMTGND